MSSGIKNNIENILALTPLQEGILFHYLKDPDSDLYFEQLCLQISGAVDTDIFKKAWGFVVGNNEMLRTLFRWKKIKEPVQIVLKEHPPVLRFVDLSPVAEIKIEDRQDKFDLEQVPFRVTLCKIAEDKYEMIISSHHILYDGWSTGIILKEFFSAYGNLTENRSLKKPKKNTFFEYVKWLQNKSTGSQQEYWEEYLSGFEVKTTLPLKTGEKGGGLFAQIHDVELKYSFEEKFGEFVRGKRLLLSTVFYCAYGILLQKYNNIGDVIFGTTVAGRSAKIEGIEGIVGLFINTIPLRIKAGPCEKVFDLLEEVNHILHEREEYENTSLLKIKECSQLHHTGELFDSIVVIENYPLSSVLSGKKSQLTINSYDMFEMTNYDLTVSITLTGGINIRFIYNDALFEQAAVERLSRHFSNILEDIVDNPGKNFREVDILSPGEKQQLLFEFNDTKGEYPGDKTIHGLFMEQVWKTPDSTAVVAFGQGSRDIGRKSLHLTYREFDRETGALSSILIKERVGPGTITVVMVERSIEMVIQIFAILKTGGAYLPIGPEYPEERKQYIIKDSGALPVSIVETQYLASPASGGQGALLKNRPKTRENAVRSSKFHTLISAKFPQKIFDEGHNTAIPSLGGVPEGRGGSGSPAYIIYTSGSTGKPKGVAVEHRSVVNIITALQRAYPLTESDTYLFKTSYVFDVSVAELFGWFPGGGRLAILQPGGEKEPGKIIDAVEYFGVTHINFVPSMFNVFVEALDESNAGRLATLKYIFLAGEALLPELVERFGKFNTKIALENIYGPTEGTVYSSSYSLSEYAGSGSIPIGKPMQNIRLYILDKDEQLQPIGVTGELCIAGVNLARGYLNQPELTADKFINIVSDGQGAFLKNRPQTRKNAVRSPKFHTLDSAKFPQKTFNNKKFCSNFFNPTCVGKRLADMQQFPEIQSMATLNPCPRGGPGRVAEGKKLYKTGDLARWLPDGSVEFLGRMDNQVKVRGFRIELGEIESRLLKHEDIREAVVIPRGDKAGDNYLCAYVVVKKSEPAEGNLKQYLSRTLPDYMIPSCFIRIEKLPLTPTGKVDRKVLPEPKIKAGKKYIAPRNNREKKLAAIWGGILDREPQTIGITDHFFELGGHSLRATRLITKLHREFDVSITLTGFFKNPTIEWLSYFIEKALKKERFISIKAVEDKEYYPLSVTQKRFFFFQQLEPGTISYNMGEILLIEGRVEKERLASTFERLIHRHESLRTSFTFVDGKPVQKIHQARDITFAVEYPDFDFSLKNGSHFIDFEQVSSLFIRPFELSRAPLLRVGLSRVEEEKYVLAVDMHHIISDGTSTGIFIADFLSIYKGEEPPVLRIRYRDYALWLPGRTGKNRDSGREPGYAAGDVVEELLELPTDYMRPAVQSFAGAKVGFETGREETLALVELSLREETTLFMVLFAVFNVFLSRLSGQENVVAGSPIAGRLHYDLEGIMGLFINTLTIRNVVSPGKRFSRFLTEVRENSLRAFEEQEHQYETLVNKIEQGRDSSRNPLFDVMFVLQNMEVPELEIPGLKIKRNLQEDLASKFDMTLYCEEQGDILSFELEYSTSLFKPATIVRYITYFKNILSALVRDPAKKIGDIEFISDKEKREILYDFNDKEVPYPEGKTIYRLFEEQAARTPENPAITASTEQLPGPVGDAYMRPADQECRGEPGVPPNMRPESDAGARRAVPETGPGHSLTYRELNERANCLARVLRTKGVKANAIVGIMLERSFELIVGLYAVLKAGGVYLPIDPEYPESRILSMLENSRAVMLLTGKDVVRRKNLPAISREIVYVDASGVDIEGQPGENLTPLSQPTDLIYVIFTSGSTGIPKGAGVYQRSFVNLMHWFVTDFSLQETDSNLLMTSFSFDLTQKNLYASLILGGTLNLPAVNYFDPGEMLRDIEENKVTWINCTPSMFFQLIEFCKEDELKKLQSLRYVYLGGEPISIGMFMKWLESEDCHGEIVNTYGPTECTDISNYFRIKEPHRYLREPVPIGGPVYNVRLAVVDRNLKLLPVGFAGELLIAGESVGAGYLNDRELTERKFVTCSFEQGKPGRLYYRTGDLVKWLPEAPPAGGAVNATSGGLIEFIGRMDYQVKIRGFRIEIGEIESRLLEYEAIKEAVVMDRDDESGGKYLCAYVVTQEPGSIEGARAACLREYLSRTLPDYMIPSYFLQLAEMPLNPNGKVNRKALPEPEIVSEKEYIAPRSDLESRLASIWSEILGLDKGRIGIDDNFFELGGHSLKAVELTARLHQRLNVELDLREIFRILTIRGLAESIGREHKSHYVTIASVEEKEYYSLSSAQERLYLLQRMNRENTVYNIPFVSLLEGDLNKKKLQDIFMQLIAMHESLRTTFHMLAECPVQRIHKPGDIDFKIEYYKTGLASGGQGALLKKRPQTRKNAVRSPKFHTLDSAKFPQKTFDKDQECRGEPCVPPHNHAEIIDSFIRPFELSEAPLLRTGLIPLIEKKHILVLDIHHIISDGLSMTLFITEFMSLYRGERFSPLRMRYRDYSEWQECRRLDVEMKDREAYWLEEFSGEIPVLDIPGDFPRPVRRNFDGNSITFEIGPDVTGKLKEMALKEGSTLYMVLLALFNILLSKLSGQEEIIIGSPTAGRPHADLEQVIGVFINTLAIKNFPVGQKPFREFLKEVGSRVLSAFDNQEYQFGDLVENVSVQRDIGRNPLFDVMFVMQDMDIPEVEIAGLKFRPFVYRDHTAKFDITFNCEESAGTLAFKVTYCTALFKEETISRFVGYFNEVVTAVLRDQEVRLEQIRILSQEDRREILVDFNSSGEDYPAGKTVHLLFEEQVDRTPNQIALFGPIVGKEENTCLTYRELNEEADSLSGILRQEGLMPGGIAAIDVERSVEMIVGLLAILKAGAAYLPLSPEFPKERKQYIIKDSGAKISVTAERFESRFSQGNRSYKTPMSYSALPGDPAYVMYTSGTTGRPKGVLVEHRSAVNIVTWFGREYGPRPGSRVLLMSEITFDASVNQVFGTLLHGAELYVIPKLLLLDIDALYHYIKVRGIYLINFVPQLLRELLCDREKPGELEIVISGADRLENDLKDKILDKGYRLYNHYGPTEATIDALFAKCSGEKVNLGRPIANAACYILDRYGNMLPTGITGELVVAGAGVARGYLNNPELTNKKFIINKSFCGGARGAVFSKSTPLAAGGKKFYKTGDLARRLPDGNIEFIGRMDYQVKIRGFRIEVGEIENRLLDHEMIKEAVVIDRDDETGEKYLCAYIVPAGAAAPAVVELQEYLSGTLPDYMIPSYFVQMEEMPLNRNGKIDRNALPVPGTSKLRSGYTPPRNELEKKLVDIWAEVLNIQTGSIGIGTNFFHAGGHSLRAAQLTTRIYKEFAAGITLAEIFSGPTIRQLSETIASAAKGKYFPLEAVEDREYYPLSSAQKRLYILQRGNPEATGYNMPAAMELSGKLEKEKLAESFGKLLHRHESFRTSFRTTAGEAKQFIHDPGDIEFHIEFYKAGLRVGARRAVPSGQGRRGDEIHSLIAEFIRPFDISVPPLLRAGLISLEKENHILMVDMHHIISDGTSVGILIRDFMAIYSGAEPEAPPIRYRDFSEWQNLRKESVSIKKQGEYWFSQFAGDLPELKLPTDYPDRETGEESFAGDILAFEIDAGETESLRQLVKEEDATLFMVILALYNILLTKLNGREDVVVGVPIVGRRHADLQQTIGMFVNTLALRNYPVREKTFREFLREIKERTLQALENQDYQFDDLVDRLDHPLFSVMFSLLNLDNPELEIPGLKLRPYPFRNETSKFDLTLHAKESEDRLRFIFEYSTRLFKEETIERYANYFKEIMSDILENRDVGLSDIHISLDLSDSQSETYQEAAGDFEF